MYRALAAATLLVCCSTAFGQTPAVLGVRGSLLDGHYEGRFKFETGSGRCEWRQTDQQRNVSRIDLAFPIGEADVTQPTPIKTGFSFELDALSEQDWFNNVPAVGRAYLLIWAAYPAIEAKLRWPLASANDGQKWYPSFELERWRVATLSPNLTAIVKASYSPDPLLGLRADAGVCVRWREVQFTIMSKELSVEFGDAYTF